MSARLTTTDMVEVYRTALNRIRQHPYSAEGDRVENALRKVILALYDLEHAENFSGRANLRTEFEIPDNAGETIARDLAEREI